MLSCEPDIKSFEYEKNTFFNFVAVYSRQFDGKHDCSRYVVR